MRITGVETILVRPPAGSHGGALWTFVKLLTDSGIVGWGEVQMSANTGAAFGPGSLTGLVQELTDAALIGEDPSRISWLMQRLYEDACLHYPDASLLGVMSALDICLWDILGKDLNRPVHALLGGRVRDRLRAYTYLGAVAHPAGPIEADRRLHKGDEGRRLELAVRAPGELEVRAAPEGPLAGIPVRATVHKR